MSSPKFAAKSVKPPKSASNTRSKASSKAQLSSKARDMRRAYHAMTEAEKAERRWRQAARPPLPRAGSARSMKARVSNVAQAFCDWSDVEAVFRMYVAAAVMTELTGVMHVVDHAVPLSNPLVCGLHTHTNMQVITQRANYAKSNWLWPDMWPVDWSTMQLIEQWQEQQGDRLEAANDDEQSSRSAAPERRARP